MLELGISRDELAALRVLNRRRVRYLLIGGNAMRAIGIDRKTCDVDLLLGNSESDISGLLKALPEILGRVPKLSAEDLRRPLQNATFKICGLALDILTSVKGVSFDESFARQERTVKCQTVIPVASRLDRVRIRKAAVVADPRRKEREWRDIALLEQLTTR